MNPAEIAAYIGAAAWLPQIITWVYKYFSVPALTIVPERSVEIGFTTYGPIFNLRCAFMCERKELILDDLQVQLVHQDGEVRTLRWAGVQEDLGETVDAEGLRQGRMMKDQVPIALKVSTTALVEKLVRFQDPRYKSTDRPLFRRLVEHNLHLFQTNPFTSRNETLASREYREVITNRQGMFWWKPGRYELVFEPKAAAKRFQLKNARYSFELTQLDLDNLRPNVEAIRTHLHNTVNFGLEGFTPAPIDWRWSYPELVRVDE